MSTEPLAARRCASSLSDVRGEAGPRLQGLLLHFSIPPEDAEDLLQEVCLQFLRKEELVAEPAAWLYGALRKECLLYWRKRRRKLYCAIDEGLMEVVADPATDAAEMRLFRRETHEAMSRLRGRCRVILSLRYGLEMERSAVADQVGCAAVSVDKLTRRCLNALGRTLLAPVRRTLRG